MSEKPVLSRITIYPVKSLDGMTLEKSTISDGGCLLHDREYAISDEKGKFIIGKTNSLVHTLRSKVDFDQGSISFRSNEDLNWEIFNLHSEKNKIESFLSEHFGFKTILQQNKTGRFLDVPDRSGMTILSRSSLEEVSKWYSINNIEDTRDRFRATLELDNVPAFWEDQLFSKEGTAIHFQIGEVNVYGMSPRARCVVPSRSSKTGEVTRAFPKIFSKEREANLPNWSEIKEHGHFYHLSVDCLIPVTEVGKNISLGDPISIIGKKDFRV